MRNEWFLTFQIWAQNSNSWDSWKYTPFETSQPKQQQNPARNLL